MADVHRLLGSPTSFNKRLGKMIVIGSSALTAVDLSLGKSQEVTRDTVLLGFISVCAPLGQPI